MAAFLLDRANVTYLEARAQAEAEKHDDEYVVRVERQNRSWIAVYGLAGPLVDGKPTGAYRGPDDNGDVLYAVPPELTETAAKNGLRRIVTRREQVGML